MNWLFFVLLLVVHEVSAESHKTVCLNMIVKNESAVITRCLESVLPLIDTWVICDTGSTDGTQQIIINYMKEKNIPGELHERPWKNFAHNRNEALQLGKDKADYLLFIDADEYLVYDKDFTKPVLDKDYYYLILTWPGSQWKKVSLINTAHSWKWEGVLHEVICPPQERTFATLDKVKNIYTVDGARSKDPLKYQKDAEVLEAALKDDPNNSRYVFYLAKSYESYGNKQKALENYQRRANMGFQGDTEAFWSQLQVGILQEELQMPAELIINSYKKAVPLARMRAEPYYQLAHFYSSIGDYYRAYHVAKIGVTIPIPEDTFFIEEWIYSYGLLMELSINAFWIGKYEESQNASCALLKIPDLPASYRECAEQNLGFANEKLLEEVCATGP